WCSPVSRNPVGPFLRLSGQTRGQRLSFQLPVRSGVALGLRDSLSVAIGQERNCQRDKEGECQNSSRRQAYRGRRTKEPIIKPIRNQGGQCQSVGRTDCGRLGGDSKDLAARIASGGNSDR